MPIWALFAVAAVTCAVAETFSTLGVLKLGSHHHWTLGYLALSVGFVNLMVIVVVVVLVTTVLRSIDRRTR